ncbi:MAG: methyl-accepting chemotaxis protein [Shewanellaceae bacterium]|nr:methyl-accepting chemotaxis protein [Shewanellaceae bacterium]
MKKIEFSFNQQVVGISSTILFVALTSLATLEYMIIQNDIKSIIQNNVREVSDSIMGTIDQAVNNKIELANYTADLLKTNLSTVHINKVINQPSLQKAFTVTGVAFERNGSSIDNSIEFELPNWDPRTEQWYQTAKDAQQTIVSDPFIGEQNQATVITIAVPIYINFKFYGVLFNDLNLKDFMEILDKMTFRETGYTFLISETGLILSHPNRRLIGQHISKDIGDLKIIEGRQIVELNGQTKYLDFKKALKQPLYLGVIIDAEKVLASVTVLRNFAILLTLFFVGLSILILSFFIIHLMKPVNNLKQTLKAALGGNMEALEALPKHRKGEFGELNQNFHTFTQSLTESIAQSKVLQNKMQESGQKNLELIQLSHKAITEQQAEVEQLTQTVHEMTTTSYQVAENAKETAVATQTADDAAKHGSNVVDSTAKEIINLATQIETSVEVINSLGENVKDIESILAVINDIADQTNLLALNAAIEAARAGEKGRGFAVVADEVRNLAKRTQEATSEISNMIEKLQGGSITAVETMQTSKEVASVTVNKSNEANQAIQTILEAINKITDMNAQIASAAEEQNNVTSSVNEKANIIKNLGVKTTEHAQQVTEQMNQQANFIADHNDNFKNLNID